MGAIFLVYGRMVLPLMKENMFINSTVMDKQVAEGLNQGNSIVSVHLPIQPATNSIARAPKLQRRNVF
jgi:hypothetical protein